MRRALVVGVIAAIVAGACSSGHSSNVVAANTNVATNRVLFVGSGATAGEGASDPFHNAWPRLVFTEAFPVGSTSLNAATHRATIAEAAAQQPQLASDFHPDVVLVWLANNDVRAGVPAATMQTAMRDLVGELRTLGATRILVGNVPVIDGGPPTAAANAAIAAGVAASGAQLVDLSTLHMTTEDDGDVNMTTALGRAIADRFEQALKPA